MPEQDHTKPSANTDPATEPSFLLAHVVEQHSDPELPVKTSMRWEYVFIALAIAFGIAVLLVVIKALR